MTDEATVTEITQRLDTYTANWKREHVAVLLLAQEMNRELQNWCKDEIHIEQAVIISDGLMHLCGSANPNEILQQIREAS